jgi:LPS sulfotransferase NodH
LEDLSKDPFLDPTIYDLAAYAGKPKRDYIVCTTPRVGSNLLCSLLARHSLGVPAEYFHTRKYLPILAHQYRVLKEHYEPVLFDFMIDELIQSGQFSYSDYIEALKRHRTSESGFFGFKAHWGQFKRLKREVNIHSAFDNLKFVYLEREDKIAQAISMHKASLLKQWTSNQDKKGNLDYSDQHISECLNIARKSNKLWQEWFLENEITPVKISFEQLLGNTKTVLSRIAEHLGAELGDIDDDLSKGVIQSQNDEINAAWKKKYLSDHPEEVAE